MNIKEIKNFVSKIDGFLHDIEGKLLFNLAKNCKGKGVIVEIGSWKGTSTIWLANGSKFGNNVKIYAIDPHTGADEQIKMYGKVDTFEEFITNIKNAKVSDIVVPIRKTSEQAAKNFNRPVELIFIDGAHDYELVKLDFELWFPKVLDGGIMAFHDTIGWNGPKKLVVDYVYKSKHFKDVKFKDSITYARKVKQNSIKDRVKNRFVLLFLNLYEFVYKLLYLLKQIKIIRIVGKKLIEILRLRK